MVDHVNGICLVAHPDDCVIFGYSYIYHHPEIIWTIGYLTYTERDHRGREFQHFWQQKGIATVFLGFEDHWHDNQQKRFTRWDPALAKQACARLAESYDLVLTHDEHGDYGHIHHQLVNHAVSWHPRLITFAKLGEGTEYRVPDGTYHLDQLPLHADIIRGFHTGQHRNFYKERS